jgi:hypothetical protein
MTRIKQIFADFLYFFRSAQIRLIRVYPRSIS